MWHHLKLFIFHFNIRWRHLNLQTRPQRNLADELREILKAVTKPRTTVAGCLRKKFIWSDDPHKSSFRLAILRSCVRYHLVKLELKSIEFVSISVVKAWPFESKLNHTWSVWPDWAKFQHFAMMLIFWQFWKGSYNFFQINLVNFLCYRGNFHCCNGQTICPPGHTARDILHC